MLMAWLGGLGESRAAMPDVGGPGRPALSLDGEWQFQLDPKSEGMAAGWFRGDLPFSDRIRVPGNWQAQGFGPPGGIARHNYQGKAWYRRTFRVPPTWSGRRVWLRFAGVCNWGEAYVNGRQVGRIETFITPFEFDVTEAIRLDAENCLCVLVDSEPACHYIGMMQFLVKTGGITSHVSLEARPDPRIDRVAVRAAPDLQAVRTTVVLRRGQAGSAWRGRVRVRLAPADAHGPAAEAELPIGFAPAATESEPTEVTVSLPHLRPWSPEEPVFYRVDAELLGTAGIVDQVTLRTGLRTLVTDVQAGNLLLNGRTYFLRGCGYDSLEPIYGSPPPDKQVYLERLRHLRSYGFNAIRFLAHTPLREFFEAADEAGFLVQTEGEWFLAAAPMSAETAALFKAQVPRMIREFENHPSWFSFSCFNEAFNAHQDPVKQDYIQSAFKTFRAMKPDHFFVASDGGGDQWPTDLITDRAAMDRAEAPEGQPAGRPQQVFRGRIDDLAIFHRALSEAELRELADDLTAAEPRRLAVAKLQPAARWPKEITAPGVSLVGEAPHALPPRGGAFTVSARIRPEGFAKHDWGTFFSCGAAEPGRALILALNGEAGDGRLVIGRFFDNVLTSKRALQAATWNHVTLSYDGQRIRLWVNGQRDAELETWLDIPPHDLAIGRLVDRTMRNPADYRSRPHVWHEFNNTYIAPLPDLEIEQRLTGTQTQAWVLAPHRRRLETYGLLARYPELRQRSLDFYREYVKQAFEGARRMPRLDGYGWWVVSDIPGGVETDVTSYGILDMLYQPEKFPDRNWFLQFNGASVLLIDNEIDQRVLSCGQTRSVKLILAHYGPRPVEGGRVVWKVTAGERVLQHGQIEGVGTAAGGNRPLGSIALGPWVVPVAAKVQLDVALESEACRATNRWDFWVFPARKQGLRTSRIVNCTGEKLVDARYELGTPGARYDGQVALATKLSPELVKHLERGGRVILLDQDAERAAVSRPGVVHEHARPAPRSAILRQPGVQTYWAYWLRCNAHVVERHPALGDFPHDCVSAFQLMRLYGSAVATIDFTPRTALARDKVRPIVWGLSLIPWTEDASPFRFALAYGSMLSECRIGPGRLLVCNLYVLDGLRRQYPEAGYLLDCLVEYALADRGDPPVQTLTAEDIEQHFVGAK
jgi:hypothetical protein